MNDSNVIPFPVPPTDGTEAIKRVCMDCGAHLGGPINATVISHGLCEADFAKRMAEVRLMKAAKNFCAKVGVLLLLVFIVTLPLQAGETPAPPPLDSRLAVRAIVGEAANQGERGMLAVAGAIRNRGTLRGVYGVKNPVADRQPAWVWARAEKAWRDSATNDVTHGATHWENCRAFGTPAWARSMTVTATIKDHTFFK
jgi:hypothetical protein